MDHFPRRALTSLSLILALGYGTDCTFHLYDIGYFQVKKKKKNLHHQEVVNKSKRSSLAFLEVCRCTLYRLYFSFDENTSDTGTTPLQNA